MTAVTNVKVKLSGSNMLVAAMIGVQRHVQNTFNGARPAHGLKPGESVWDLAIDGAVAELAVAKAMDKHWDGALGNYDAADVGQFQVRSTRHADGHLIVHDSDDSDAIFILVLSGAAPIYEIAGWKFGGDAKNGKYRVERRPGHPCFWVPQSDLEPFEELQRFRWKLDRGGRQ